MTRNSRYLIRLREKAVGASLHGADTEPVFEPHAEMSSKRCRVLPSQRVCGIGPFPLPIERGFYPNLGGTADVCLQFALS